jgi:predicted metal-dependent hydrolase
MYNNIRVHKDCAWFDGNAFLLPDGLTPEIIKYAVIDIYKRELFVYLMEIISHYSKKLKVYPTKIRITNAKTRWGSCSENDGLNFSWRLALADEDMIEYVAVHELAHILEHNHSPRFWAIVAETLPDYRERQLKFKALQQKLMAQDWD